MNHSSIEAPKSAEAAIAPDPIKQWDQAAAHLLKKELAPKGFSQIKTGPYKGRHKSNLEFLSRETVGRCQILGGNLIRAYRDRAKDEILKKIEATEKQLIDVPFYKFRRIWIYRGILEALKGTHDSLDKVEAK